MLGRGKTGQEMISLVLPVPEDRAEAISSFYMSPQTLFRATSSPEQAEHSACQDPAPAHPSLLKLPSFLGLSYRWLLNEFPNFIPTDGRHFVSQTTGNLYIARTNASDLGNYSCLATSHMDFSTKSVFSKFAQLNLAAEGQDRGL